MNRQLPTWGRLERDLSQRIQKLYREELEHSPQKVTCKFFKNFISIMIEDALTAVEEILADENRNNVEKTAKQLNLAINDAVKSKLKTIVEDVLAIEVEDILFDCSVKTRRAGAIVILNQLPQTRSLKPSPKIRQSQDKSQDKNEGDVDRSHENNLASTTELEE